MRGEERPWGILPFRAGGWGHETLGGRPQPVEGSRHVGHARNRDQRWSNGAHRGTVADLGEPLAQSRRRVLLDHRPHPL
jgi:hypothetical protein